MVTFNTMNESPAVLSRKKTDSLFRAISFSCGVIVMIISILVIIGWTFDIQVLKSLSPSYISMKINTAISFLLLGISLILTIMLPEGSKARIISVALSSFVIIISSITLGEYIFSWDPRIDELIFSDTGNTKTLFPGRMAFNTGVCFILSGISIILPGQVFKNRGIGQQVMALSVMIICLLPVLAYIFRINDLETFAFVTAMALHTAIAFIILSTGILLYKAEEGVMSVLTGKGTGGFMARRIIPVIIGFPVLFVLIRIPTSGWQFWNTSMDVLFITLVFFIFFSFVTLRVARSLNDLDNKRTLVENALRASEQRFLAVFRASPSAIVLTNPEDGEIIDLNAAFSKMIGYSEDILLRRKTRDMNLWADPGERSQILAELRESGQVYNRQIVLRTGSGDLRHCIASYVLIDLYGGKCMLSSAIDITEIRQAQEALMLSESRFRSTLDNMLEGGQLLDFNWTYLYINDAAAQHNRRPREELIGKNYREMWPGIEDTEVYNKIETCMTTRVPQVMRNEFVFPDGKKGWFDLRIQPVPEGVFILSADISRNVHSEKYDRLASTVLEHLTIDKELETVIPAILGKIKDATGFEAVAIRLSDGPDYPYFSTSGFPGDFVTAENRLCSYNPDGSPVLSEDGDPLLACMCGNILKGRIDTSKSFFSSGGSFYSGNTTDLLAGTTDSDRLARTRNRCNSSGYETVILVPLRTGNEIVGLLQLNDHRKNFFDDSLIPFLERLGSSIGIAVLRNMAENEIRSMNADLEDRIGERTRQLRESNQELESFAYSISHDLKAPLRHIIGFSEKLDSEAHSDDRNEITRLTGIIRSSAERMNTLIEDLLSYSRLGRQVLKIRAVDLDKIVEEIIAEASDKTSNRQIIWKISKLPVVYADFSMIYVLLQNLIQNAIKFTGLREKAVIEIGFAGPSENNPYYEFCIRDNGAGFDMQYADKLFGVFQRLHSMKEFPGTGIGLANVKKIVTRHGGTVRAEGTVERGAAIFFTLPAENS